MTLKVTVTEDVSTVSVSGDTTSINLTGEQTEISVVNPAATVTYNPSSPFTATNVQDALPQAYKMIGEQLNNFPIKINHYNDFEINAGGSDFFRMRATGSQAGWDSLLWSSDDITIKTHNNINIAEFKDTRIHFNKQIEMQGFASGDYQEGFLNTDNPSNTHRHHIRCKAGGTPVAYLGGTNSSEPTAFFGVAGTSIAIQSSFFSGDIFPSGTTGGNRDAAVNLGKTSSRFKDLYLSGGIYFGTDTNKFEPEQGTWTPTLICGNSLPLLIFSAKYAKIGNQVNVTAEIVFINTNNATSGSLILGGLPFQPNGKYPCIVTDSNIFTGFTGAASGITNNSDSTVSFRQGRSTYIVAPVNIVTTATGKMVFQCSYLTDS